MARDSLIPNVPQLPTPSASNVEGLKAWGNGLITALGRILQRIILRANNSLPKSGQERMDGALPLVSQNPLVSPTVDIAAGQLGYDSGAGQVQFWNGAAWAALGGGGGGAPTTAQYVVMALDGTLTAERKLTVTSPITLTDGGANGNATLALSTPALQALVAGDPTITLMGDVTGLGPDEIATTIEPGVVTNTKLANMAGLTFKGNATAVSAVPQDVSADVVKSTLDLIGFNTGDQTITLQGDVAGSGQDLIPAIIRPRAVSYPKMTAATAASILLGRGAGAGGGDWQEITLGANMTMTGTVLDSSAAGGSGLTHPQVMARVSGRA